MTPHQNPKFHLDRSPIGVGGARAYTSRYPESAATTIDVQFSPAGNFIGTVGSEGFGRLWDANTGELVRVFEGHADRIYRMAFSPDGSLLATASWDDTAKIWRVSSGELLYTLSAGAGDVKSVDFSTDGTFLVTAHEDGTAQIWDVSTIGTEFQEVQSVRTLVGYNSTVWDATFSPDGDHLATISFDGPVRLWDAKSGDERWYGPGITTVPIWNLVLMEDTLTSKTGMEL